MVDFSSYVTPMNREYGTPSSDEPSTNDAGIGVKDIGWGLPMGIGAQNIQGIAAKIREGAGHIEIQFSGAGSGQRGSQTPGMYGDEQRQALKEMAKINEVNFTTHATFGIMGLAGMDPRSGNFSAEYRKNSVDEIKRAIEFAADAAQGGSVVVHTGEYQRPISEEPWALKDQKDQSKGYMFKAYEGEEKEAVIRVVDDRTGQIMTQVRKNENVPRPVWLKDDKGNYVDYEGNQVDRNHRVPEYDSNSGRFKVETKGWDYFIGEAKEMNEDLANKKGVSISELKTRYPDQYVEPEEAYLRATLEANAGHARGWALQYSQGFEDALNKLKSARAAGNTEAVEQIKKQMEYMHEASVSQQQMAQQSEEAMEHVKSAEKFALNQSFTSYAEAGIHALDQTRAKDLKDNPLFISMENIYPESYGAHPDELKELVMKSRERMAEMISDPKSNHYRGISKKEADKVAETHIKATLDVGHLNTWRKYWQNDPKKTMQQNDADFKKWMLDKTEDLSKSGIIGNVHLADNYGYQDEHLIPGQGTTPIKEMVEIMRNHGYKGPLTVEAGSAATTDVSDFHGLMKTWKMFGSPVYGAHAASARGADSPRGNWGDIQYSYLGQTHSPYYVFGSYSPSQDWTLWSQTPLE